MTDDCGTRASGATGNLAAASFAAVLAKSSSFCWGLSGVAQLLHRGVQVETGHFSDSRLQCRRACRSVSRKGRALSNCSALLDAVLCLEA